jgi:hypothetical protein
LSKGGRPPQDRRCRSIIGLGDNALRDPQGERKLQLECTLVPRYSSLMPRTFPFLAAALLVAACATTPSYDETWSWDSPFFDEEAVLGQAGLLPAQQDTFYTSIWTLGGGSLKRRREYQLRTQHELWVRRQVELGKMSVDEAHTRIRDYTPTTAL